MLPYIIPLDVIGFYFKNIHGLLQGHYKEKGLICCAVYCVCRLIYKIGQACSSRMKISARKKLSATKYKDLLLTLDKSVNDQDMSITNLSFSDLCNKVQDHSLNPEDIYFAFLRRAMSVDLYTNAVVDLLEPQNLSSVTRAIADRPRQEAQSSLLLESVPVSFAEVIQVKGMESTAGLSAFLQLKASDDATVIKLLRAQGAMPILRTNVPQTAYFTLGSSNPIFGPTYGPLKHGRSPGGTSCGEAVIVASKGSLLGVGTDVAGGIRIPAYFCGICGLKPTSQRVSCKGVTIVVEGQNVVATCVGPLSREVNGLVAFMKSVCVPLQHELDPTVPLMLFNNEMYESTKSLKVGYFINDSHTECIPSVRRTVIEAKVMLEKSGHELVPFEVPDLLHMLTKLYLPAVLGDHYITLIRYLAIDKLDRCVRWTYYSYHIMHAIRWLWSWCINIMNPVNAHVFAVRCPVSVFHWWEHVHKIEVWKQQFINRMISDGIDALLCPVMPCAAVKQGSEADFVGCLTYCALFNLLDFPAGTVPTSMVTAGDIEVLRSTKMYRTSTRLEKKIKLDQLGKEASDNSLNLPVGVQIASLPFQEEMVLRLLKDLESQAAK